MVAHVGGYHGATFKGFWGVMQGKPLPPTILNVIVCAGVRTRFCWLKESQEGRMGGEGRCNTYPTFSTRMMAWSH